MEATVEMNKPGRPRTRNKEYWTLYLRLKQREFRAKSAGNSQDLLKTRNHISELKQSVFGSPIHMSVGMERRRAI